MKSFVLIFCLLCAFQRSEQQSGQCENVSFKYSLRRIVEVAANVAQEFKLAHYPENGPLRTEYDFVIVGASPAGCLLANRLTENPSYSVLLLEVGTAEDLKITGTPISAPNLQSTAYNWGYRTEVQARACRCMYCKRSSQKTLV